VAGSGGLLCLGFCDPRAYLIAGLSRTPGLQSHSPWSFAGGCCWRNLAFPGPTSVRSGIVAAAPEPLALENRTVDACRHGLQPGADPEAIDLLQRNRRRLCDRGISIFRAGRPPGTDLHLLPPHPDRVLLGRGPPAFSACASMLSGRALQTWRPARDSVRPTFEGLVDATTRLGQLEGGWMCRWFRPTVHRHAGVAGSRPGWRAAEPLF